MAFVEMHPSRRRDIWLMRLAGSRQPEELVATDANETDAKFSPDGHWLAYVSDETGRDEIFVRPIGGSGGRKQLSSAGGAVPVWAPNGRALFFMKGDQLATIFRDGEGNFGHDQILFTVPKFEDLQVDPRGENYDIMPDGQHFIFELLSGSSAPTTHYNLVLNWFTELRKKMSPPR
jgi:Tol biopolymer transport system component